MYGFITLALAAVAAALPTPQLVTLQERSVADVYHFYQGDGSTGAGWPAMTSWGSFDELWNANMNILKNSCNWNGWGNNNSDAEISALKDAITQVSQQAGVDNRFVFAVVLQESKGCVRAPTTNNGVRNPGLMQSHNGAGTCAGVNPCPASQITQMIKDGVLGTPDGDGLKQTFQKSVAVVGNPIARAYYGAARLYNSGSIDWTNLNNGLGSTACYATDVASRLTGWTLAASACLA